MDFFFREYGTGETIVILHGWLGVSDHWLSAGKFLASQGYNVLIPDLPNHGKSFHTEKFSFKEMGEILNCFCQAKDLKKPILLAHSMGGKIAMEMIKENQDYFKALILVDIHFRRYERSDFNILLNSLLIQTNISQFNNLSEFKNYFLEKGIDKEWVAVLLKNLEYKKNTLQWKSNIPMLAQEVDEVLAEVDFKRIDIPTLLIRGENSNYVKEEDCISFKEKFPNSKIVSVPNSGHWVQVDNPSFFLKEVMEFLK